MFIFYIIYRIVLDPLYPAPDQLQRKLVSNDVPQELKYSLIFDDELDKPELNKILNNPKSLSIA